VQERIRADSGKGHIVNHLMSGAITAPVVNTKAGGCYVPEKNFFKKQRNFRGIFEKPLPI